MIFGKKDKTKDGAQSPAKAVSETPKTGDGDGPARFSPDALVQEEEPSGLPGGPATSQTKATGRSESEAQDVKAKLAAAAFGEVVGVLMHAPGFKHYSLADLEWLVLPAIALKQFSVASASNAQTKSPRAVGVALWAKVSDDVDQRLSTALDVPIRLRPDEWRSGETIWLVAMVGPQQIMTPFMKHLGATEFGGRAVKMRALGDDGKPTVKQVRFEGDAGPSGD